MGELVSISEPPISIKNTAEVPAPKPLLPELIIPPAERPMIGDPKRESFRLAVEMSKSAAKQDGEKAYRELQEKGYFIPLDSTVEGMLDRVTRERPEEPWVRDERTGQYVKHAIETARKYAGDHAIWELGNLGITITEKSTVAGLLKQLEPYKWLDNDLTKQFLDCGIANIKEQKRLEEQAKKGESIFAVLEWKDDIFAALRGEPLPSRTATAKPQELPQAKVGGEAVGALIEVAENDPLAKEAYDSLTSLGFWVRADSDRTSIMEFVKQHAWQDDEPTRAYIEKALDYAEEVTPEAQQFDNKENTGIHYLTADPHAGTTDALFLPKFARDFWGVKPGDTIPVQVGGVTREIRVERPRVRDNGTIEGVGASQIRVSADVLESFGIPKLTPTKMRFDRDTNTLNFDPKPETVDTKKILFRETRGLSVEKGASGVDMVYLSDQDQNRLQLKPGDVITIKMGNYLKQVTIEASGQTQQDESAADSAWRLSQNLMDDIGMPEEIALRSAFDKEKRELIFGPTIALIETSFDSLAQEQKVKNPHAEAVLQTAADYGALAISLDPRRQTKDDLKNGFVRGVVWTGTEYKSVRIPRPDVLYGKMSRNVRQSEEGDAPTLNELRRSFPKNIISGWAAHVGADKLWFDYGLQTHGMEKYRAQAKSLHNIAPEDFSEFLEKHTKVIIKPQIGAVGTGVFEVERLDDGTYMVRENIRGSKTAPEGMKETPAQTAQEALSVISQVPEVAKRVDNMREFMMQEKIDMYEFGYDDPGDGQWISGHPEPRVLVQRGADGAPLIGGIVARMQNDKLVTPHNLHIMDVLHGIYPHDEQKVWEKLKEIERVAVQVLEMAEKEAAKRPGVKSPQHLGEFVVDFGIKADGELALIEASSGAMTNVYQDNYGEKVKNMQDALESRAAGPIAYALHLSGMAA